MTKYTWTHGFLEDINFIVNDQFKVSIKHVKIEINSTGWIYMVYINKYSLWWWFNYTKLKKAISRITPRGVTVTIKKFNKRRLSYESQG